MRSTPPDFYLCTAEDLENAIEDLRSNRTRYVVSLRMVGGLNVYGLPTTLEQANESIEEITYAMENGEVVQMNHTIINTKNVCTARILKYMPEEKDDNQN